MLAPDTLLTTVRSPKRRAVQVQSRSNWFGYYAGFSFDFVEDIIAELNLADDTILLDPWLGGGTTAEVAAARGMQFKGYDLNPSMLLVAKARTFSKERASELSNIISAVTNEFERRMKIRAKSRARDDRDPLEQWLQPRSARAFRTLESIVAQLDQTHSTIEPTWLRCEQVSSAASVVYVAMFRTLRHFISRFQSSNPTWIKLSTGGPRIHISDARILNRFLKEVHFLQDASNSDARILIGGQEKRCVIAQGSSTNLPLASHSVDAIVSSPPYCTRIDYVRATLPELALIGFPDGIQLRDLRNRMMGTPTVGNCIPQNDHNWGPTCNEFLSRVDAHKSKASSSYYIKYFRQYFAAAFSSLIELDRVLKRSGRCVLVVQDSYYKDIFNDLPLIFSEMTSQLGWQRTRKLDFRVVRTFAAIHPQTKRYRKHFGG